MESLEVAQSIAYIHGWKYKDEINYYRLKPEVGISDLIGYKIVETE